MPAKKKEPVVVIGGAVMATVVHHPNSSVEPATTKRKKAATDTATTKPVTKRKKKTDEATTSSVSFLSMDGITSWDTPLETLVEAKQPKQVVYKDNFEGQTQTNTITFQHEKELVSELNLSLDLQRGDVFIPEGVISKQSKQQVNDCEFYLYYDLEKQAAKKTSKLDNKEQDILLSNLKSLDEEGCKIVFVLIRMFALKQQPDGQLFQLPFNSKVVKQIGPQSDIEFDLKDLPVKLQRMMLLFTKKHLECIQEVSIRATF